MPIDDRGVIFQDRWARTFPSLKNARAIARYRVYRLIRELKLDLPSSCYWYIGADITPQEDAAAGWDRLLAGIGSAQRRIQRAIGRCYAYRWRDDALYRQNFVFEKLSYDIKRWTPDRSTE